MTTRKKVPWMWTLVLSSFILICLLAPYFSRGAEAQGGVTGFANLRITNFYRAAPRAAITVADNGTINSTGTYQKLTAAAAVGTSGDNLTIKPAGSVLILVNVGAQTITITETANMKSAGNIALGTLDSATLLSDGADWYQIAASNN